jgi:hypothetical protein
MTMRNTAALCLAVLSSYAIAQINDAQAISQAEPYIARFAPEAINVAPRLYREEMEAAGGSIQIIHVTFGEAIVFLYGSGQFKGFANLSGESRLPNSGGPDKYASDADAWNALDAILFGIDLPSGLTRKKLVRESRVGQPFVMRFTMHPRPNNYEADGGNQVNATIHRITGRVLSLSVARGWTYEAPNVRISPEEAIAATRVVHGGSVQDWQTNLKYMTVANTNAPVLRCLVSTWKCDRRLGHRGHC